jgi:hypothetical protein
MAQELISYLKARIFSRNIGSSTYDSGIIRDAWDGLHAGYYGDTPIELRNAFSAASLLETRGILDIRAEFYMQRSVLLNPTTSAESNINCILRDVSTDFCPDLLHNAENMNPEPGNSTIVEIPPDVSLVEFLRLSQARKPFIVRQLCKDLPAIKAWNNARFWSENFGTKYVPIEVGGYLSRDFLQVIISFNDFIHYLKSGDSGILFYLAQLEVSRLSPLLEEFLVPLPDQFHVLTGSFTRYLFLGPRGTESPYHVDPQHNLLCQIVGVKYVSLYPPGYKPSGSDEEHHNQGMSAAETGLATDRGPLEGVIRPGDCLFIPRGWWHYIKSLSLSCSVAHFFEH